MIVNNNINNKVMVHYKGLQVQHHIYSISMFQVQLTTQILYLKCSFAKHRDTHDAGLFPARPSLSWNTKHTTTFKFNNSEP